MANAGLVVIGRNEGERLRACLTSAAPHVAPGLAVYVDSGSSDGSVELARSMNFEVVQLDSSAPFTAARARNAGVKRLLELAPDTTYVQFVDGDCEIVAGWWEKAAARLAAERKDLAVVCGRRRERYPEKSVYNRLCDIEWNTPVGETDACGGDSMMRVEAFGAVNGFNSELIAGEEPELCLRLRRAGWKIERIDADMTLHDAAMTRVSQWWRRELRTGYAMAEAVAMHGRGPERFRVGKHRSNWVWGLILPLLAIAPAYWTRGWSLVLLAAYLVQWLRIRAGALRQRCAFGRDATAYATHLLLGKFPQMIGQMKYWIARALGRRSKLIEYKDATTRASIGHTL
jgi:GT2 family glycosyltransferase